jgi:hypothetical protein
MRFKFRPKRPLILLTVGYGILTVASIGNGFGTPQFARQTKLACSACHSHIPLLNEFGQKFYANGFRLDKGHKMFDTVPVWGTFAAQSQATPGSKVYPVSTNTSELASYGSLPNEGLLYHFEFFPTTNDVTAYGIKSFGEHFAVAAGNINVMSQYDPGLDISLSTPIFLAPGLTGPNNSLQGPFSPGGTLMGVRLSSGTGSALPYGQGWQAAATVPFSNEIGNAPGFDTTDTARGVFLETFNRQGMNSYGLNSFFGQDGRHYYGGVVQQKAGQLFFEGGGAFAQGFGDQTHVYSLGADWIPTFDKALSFRADSQDGVLTFVPTASWELVRKKTALRLVVESAISRGIQPTTTFLVQLHF